MLIFILWLMTVLIFWPRYVAFVEAIEIKRVGGLTFWQAGRFGGSIYIQRN